MTASSTTMELRLFPAIVTGIFSLVQSDQMAPRNKYRYFRRTRDPRGKLHGHILNLSQ